MCNSLLEHRLRVFENRELRRIIGPTREEVVGGWRRLNNEELHNLKVPLSIHHDPSRYRAFTTCSGSEL
jgi:hypothetical protein